MSQPRLCAGRELRLGLIANYSRSVEKNRIHEGRFCPQLRPHGSTRRAALRPAWAHTPELLDAAKSTALEMLNLCVWTKPNAGMGGFYRSQHELVFVFKLGTGRYRNNVQLGVYGRHRSNVWPYATGPGFGRAGEEGRLAALHPTVKPVAMVADAILDVKLQEVRDGRIRRLIINIPPRSLKSLKTSIAFPAWLLGHRPSAAIINVTYGQELSDKFARDCRAIMSARWYQSIFPTRLTEANSSHDLRSTKKSDCRPMPSAVSTRRARRAENCRLSAGDRLLRPLLGLQGRGNIVLFPTLGNHAGLSGSLCERPSIRTQAR
jgi:hypothetical protein